MLEIIDYRNRPLYQAELEDMFRMRYRVASGWNWSIPFAVPGKDKDQFDTDHTVYFIALNENREVIATSRLNPTTKPHLLDTVFPKDCTLEGIPRSADIWEFSRMFVCRKRATLKETVRLSYTLMSAVAEFALSNHLSAVTWYTSYTNYNAALACWRRTRPLGPPTVHDPDNVIYMPAISPIDELAVKRIKAKAKWEGPVAAYHFTDGRRFLSQDTPLLREPMEGLSAA